MLKMFIMLVCVLKSLDRTHGKEKKSVTAPEMLILIN